MRSHFVAHLCVNCRARDAGYGEEQQKQCRRNSRPARGNALCTHEAAPADAIRLCGGRHDNVEVLPSLDTNLDVSLSLGTEARSIRQSRAFMPPGKQQGDHGVHRQQSVHQTHMSCM